MKMKLTKILCISILFSVAVLSAEPAAPADLWRAVESGNVARVKRAFELGANVYQKDTCGSTVLMKSVAGGHSETVQVLLKHKVDVHQQNYSFGDTALIKAACNGYSGIVQVLLTSGADASQNDNYGDTVLMEADLLGYHKIFVLLKQHIAEEKKQ